MKLKKLGYILLLCFVTTSVNAVVLNLNTIPDNIGGYGDRANDYALFGGAVPKGCNFPGQCYQESGYYVGTAAADSPTLGTNLLAHIHGTTNQNTGTKGIAYENDSVGIVLKSVDSSNFNLNSLDLDLSETLANTYDGNFVIASYTINADGSRGSQIGSINIANKSQDGVLDLSLNSIFQDVGMIYMYYDPFTLENTNGTGIPAAFNARIDNIDVTAVPVPAAVYLFGTGLLGLFSLKKKSRLNISA